MTTRRQRGAAPTLSAAIWMIVSIGGLPVRGDEPVPAPVIQLPDEQPESRPTEHVANHWSKWKSWVTTFPKFGRRDPQESYAISVEAGDDVHAGRLEAIEIVDGGRPCAPCGDAVLNGTIGDCGRTPCPPPSEEVLAYYRCNFYGHYPTFWRPWPGGFQRYRPEIEQTGYDRFRTPEPKRSQIKAPADLDWELQELMREEEPALPEVDSEENNRFPAPRRVSPAPQERPGLLRSLGRAFDFGRTSTRTATSRTRDRL